MTTATAPAKTDDDWVRTAMADETVAAELLVRMKQSPATKTVQMLATPPGWSIRLPRSRPCFSRCEVFSDRRRKEASDSTRRSPTTPLSWSGGGSPSATADGFEEFSSRRRRRHSSDGRSKIIDANDISSIISRRSRKKSYTELKEEESLLMKETISLKKEISTLSSTCIEQRLKNENLKKMKLDLNYHDDQQKATSRKPSSTLATQSACFDHSQLHHHKPEEKAGSSRDNLFLLPDLNMTPGEDDFGSGTLYGMS